MNRAEDADLDRATKLEQFRADVKRESHSTKWYAGKAVQAGQNLQYVSMRYGIPVETLERWKAEWERRAQNNSGHVGNHQVLQPARSTEGQEVSQALFGDKDG